MWSSPAVVDGRVYIGSGDFKVYCLNATTGEHIWNYTTGACVFSSPAVADGKVYVGSAYGKVYCFGLHFGVHDITIINVTPSKTVVGQGYSMSINVTVENQGDFTETFNVTAYANTALIASENITLTSGNSTTITLAWNTTGFAKGNYTISANAAQVAGEIETADNTCIDGTVAVAMVGDVNNDGLVDITRRCHGCLRLRVTRGEPRKVGSNPRR